MKKIVGIISFSALALFVVSFYFYLSNRNEEALPTSYTNATYVIDGLKVELVDGVAESEAAPGSASTITTRYFGNDFKIDLNNDTREDVVFIVTQTSGGSGTMFYAVAALNTDEGYVGSSGYFLGDRIAPQTIGMSPNPKHRQVIVVNYADRGSDESMATPPSIGKSAYLKLDLNAMQWGIVEPNFEGESR